MEQKKIRIVADSSCDMLALQTVEFCVAPLKIITENKEYVDDNNLDVHQMVEDLLAYKGRSSSSCPNTNDWVFAFGDADEVYCVTITSGLSGSYNSAMLAKRTYEEKYPGRRVFVLDSLSTGPEMGLIIEKIEELVIAGKSFDEISSEIDAYSKKTGLIFMLESMKNLANNGRVNPLVAKVAGVLGIRVVGKASDEGDLEQLAKCRGEMSALDCIVEHLKALGLKKGKVKISHCFNEKAGKQLAEKVKKEIPGVRTDLQNCRGLCSFYAEAGGLLIGFERF